MAKEKVGAGAGMGGSRGGRGRTAKIGVYKKAGKKARRAEDKGTEYDPNKNVP